MNTGRIHCDADPAPHIILGWSGRCPQGGPGANFLYPG
jgi:hypothetical protein